MPQIQQVASWSFFRAMLLALWGTIYPVPYALCMGTLLVTPLITIMVIAFSRGRLAVVGDDQQITLLFVFIWTMSTPAYRAYHDVQTFSKAKPVMYAFLVAAAMELLLAAVDRWFRSIFILALLLPVLTFTYGIGVVLESNMLLDRSVPQRFITRVLRREIHWGNYRKTYNVTLAPWGGRAKSTTELVTAAIYYSLSPGADACVSMAQGAFQIPWYRVEACPGYWTTADSPK